MSTVALSVFDADRLVGTIGHEPYEDRFAFDYEPRWPRTPGAYPLSPHFRWNAKAPSSATVRRFLENLLPEGHALDVAASTFQVSRNNLFGLIQRLGAETSGALILLMQGREPAMVETTRREITRAELAARIAQRHAVPFSVWDGTVRLSIAGHQDKIAVLMEGDRCWLVGGALASTHILKPEPEDGRLAMVVANEHYCMRLGAALGLDCAPVSMLRVPAPVLVVRRFDRVVEPDRIRRLHVIDACQALDLPPGFKYERNFGDGDHVRHIRDGVGFERLFSVVRDHVIDKAAAGRGLLRWALFQYLIGNSDAHGKNVSFFVHPEGLTLAPFYDLVSVVAYDGLSHALAMGFGDAFELAEVTPFELALFAHRAGIRRAALVREMTRMARLAKQAARPLADDAVYLGEERGFVRSIAMHVERQADRLEAMVNGTRQVDPALL
ncbi:MAG: hypothetical protein RIS35_2532 [Pseudomonadota bacterium]|jgi:serine/threonine-protein kinase HipA